MVRKYTPGDPEKLARLIKARDFRKNKIVRAKLYQQIKIQKNKLRMEKRLKRLEERELLGDKAPPKQIPKTMENSKVDMPGFERLTPEEAKNLPIQDDLKPYFEGKLTPKILITTSREHTIAGQDFCNELRSVFPRSEYRKRMKTRIPNVIKQCVERDFTAILIVCEDMGKVHTLIHINLPEGPTAHYRVTSIVPMKKVLRSMKDEGYNPELILNGFNTALGMRTGRMLSTLHPIKPEFVGRTVVTWHCQRDFIFFRRHYYAFESRTKANLRETGPRFTLKLRSLQKGRWKDRDYREGEYEWKLKRMGAGRKEFYIW